MANNSIFTEEEFAEDKKDVLEMLKLGTPYSVISDELGRSKNYIVSIKQILIANGEITQEEIDSYRAEYRRNRIEREMSERAKKVENVNIRSQRKEENKQKVLGLFKQGYSQIEVARELEISVGSAQIHKDELIKEKKLKKSEIKKAISHAEDMKTILELLKLGTPYPTISEKIGRSRSYIEKTKNKLIENGEITQEELDEYRAKYRKARIEKEMDEKPKSSTTKEDRAKNKEENKQIILEMIKQGYSQIEISRSIGFSVEYVQKRKKDLIKEGKLDKSEIKRVVPKNKENEEIRDKYTSAVLEMLQKGIQKFIIRKQLQISTYQMEVVLEEIRRKKLITKEEYEEAIKKKEEKDIKFVEQSVKKGYSIKDMIEQDPTLYKSEITRMVKQLIEEGKITREQVEENKLRKFKETRNIGSEMTVKKQEDFVFKFASKGYTPREIADLDKTNSIDFNKATRIKKDLIKRGILNSTEVNEAIKNRKEEAVRKRHDADMDKIIKYTKEGFSEFEIAGFLGYSKRHIAELKTEYREKNGWFSKEELESIKKARLERKEKERLKQEERERKKAQKEQKEKEKNESLLRRYEIYRKRVVRGYDEYIKGKTKKADMFRDYLEILIEMEEKNLEVDVSDIRKASIIVADCTELATKRYLKYIIIQHNNYFGEESTIAYINRVIRENEDDEKKQELIEKLQKYKNVIHELNLKSKILKMIHKKENINDIAIKLGVTYQYVVELYKKEINTEIDQR